MRRAAAGARYQRALPNKAAATLQHRPSGPIGDHAAAVHQHNPMSVFGGQLDRVKDNDNCCPGLGRRAQQAEDGVARGGVQIGDGFVQQEHPGLGGERAGEPGAARLPPGDAVDPGLAQCLDATSAQRIVNRSRRHVTMRNATKCDDLLHAQRPGGLGILR